MFTQSTLLLTLIIGAPPSDPPLPDGAIARLGSPQWRNVADAGSSLAFAPDGSCLAITHGSALRVIDFDTGRERWKAPEIGWNPCAVVLPRGHVLVGSDNWFRLYEVATGRELKRLTVEARRLHGLSSDGNYAAVREESGLNPSRALVFDLRSGKKLWEFGGDRDKAGCYPVGFVPGQPQLVTRVLANGLTRVRIVDIRDGKVLSEWQLPKWSSVVTPNPAVLSPDGRLLWAAGGDNRVHLWDVATGKKMSTWAGHADEVIVAAFSGDGRRLVTAAKDRTLRWWDVATGKERGKIDIGATTSVLSVSPDGMRAAAVLDEEKTVLRFDLQAGRKLPLQHGHSQPVEQVAFLPDGRSLLSAAGDDTVRVWDIATRGEVRRWSPRRERFHCLAVSADGKWAATAGSDNVIRIWDIATGREAKSVTQPKSTISCLAFAPATTVLAAGTYSAAAERAEILLWDAATGAAIGTLAGHQVGVGSLSLHPDGRRLISTTSSDRGTPPPEAPTAARVWDLKTGRAAVMSGGHDRSAVVTPDGRSVILSRSWANREGKLLLIELASGQERIVFAHRPGSRDELAISPDGHLLAVSGSHAIGQAYGWALARDPGVRILDTQTGRELRRFESGHLWALAFSPDGQTLASAGGDGIVMLWDVSKVRPSSPRRIDVTDALWADLSTEASRAYQAVVALGHAGERGAALLKEKLKPLPATNPKQVMQWLADLEDPRYAVRQKAAAELASLDLSAEFLHERLKATSSAEARKSITRLLQRPDGWITDPKRLREIRAIDALQRNSSPAARRLLVELAAGDPAATLTHEARAALGNP